MDVINIGIFVYLIALVINDVHGQTCKGSRCGECTITDGCAWCRDRVYNYTRCATEQELTSKSCGNIVRRKAHRLTNILNNAFSDGGPGRESIQIKPQHVRIDLVPNSLFRDLTIEYKIARNFPLDLYFLNDPSYTMRDLRTSLINVAEDIARDINTLTTDYQFGLGTSMDKVILPFTRTSPAYINKPCGDCDPPYSFVHRQSLTNNVNNFINAVRSVNLTANFDKPEGLLDGLMQVMVCSSRIGWRNKARRMLIYATDINFHQAGDGRLAGILEPNDGQCHLDRNGKYTKAEVQDYPSIGQIIQKARENNINIIFTIGGNAAEITNQQVRNLYYDKLTQLLPGGTTAASELSSNAANILSIVGENYRRLRETVKLVVNEDSEELIVAMYTNCKTGSRTPDAGSTCDGLTTERTVSFFPYILGNLTKCPEDRNLTFTIVPEGLEERVQLDVNYVCDCDCQLEPEAVKNSPLCNGNGTFECGICNCNEGWIGEFCECDNRGTEEEACGAEAGICNNAGNCTCRTCECFDGYSGDKCQCNDRNCRSINGTLCGGPSHGFCDCGKCKCHANYTGDACECLTTTDSCQTSNGTICSGNGVCECGKCKCEAGYRGALCKECTSCPGTCENNQNCAECVGFDQGAYNSSVCKEKCINVEKVPVLEDPASNPNATIKQCLIQDKDNCIIYFNVYDYDTGREVKVRDTKRCPPGPAKPLTIGLSISGAIFLVGLLLLLIWKLLTMLYDSMEYSRFETEIQNPAWEKSENPIYKDCVTTVQNPMHETEMNDPPPKTDLS